MYQQITIVGNVGQAPELRYTQSGDAVASFSVAVNERWGSDDSQQKTTWFRVTAWRKLGEVVNQYVTKGQRVMVVGTVALSTYTKQDGTPGALLELTAREVKFLSRSDDSGGEDREELPF